MDTFQKKIEGYLNRNRSFNGYEKQNQKGFYDKKSCFFGKKFKKYISLKNKLIKILIYINFLCKNCGFSRKFV